MENSDHSNRSTAAHEPTTNGIIPDAFGKPYAIEDGVVVGPAETAAQADTDQGLETAIQDPKLRRAAASTATGIIAAEQIVIPAKTHASIVRSWKQIRPSGSSGAYDGRNSGGIGYPPRAY